MNREKGLIPLEWIPRTKSKTNSQCPCPTDDQTCCKRTDGEYWTVYAANGWDIWDDPDWAAAREVAQDAANYCPACYKKDMGRLKVAHNYYGPYMQKRLNGEIGDPERKYQYTVCEPTHIEPVEQEPVEEEPVVHETVGQEHVMQEPVEPLHINGNLAVATPMRVPARVEIFQIRNR